MCKRSYTLSQANANKVIDNFKHISNYANQQFIASRELYYKYIKEDFGKYFEHSERVLSQLKALTGSLTDIKDLFPSRYFVELPIVLNHGFLTSELVKVSPTGGIREINDWHNVSLLPIGYDVFSLMVNSFDTNLRRDHFEKVLAYFHSCFRGNALLEFKLSLLTKYYKKSIAYIAVKNLPRMLLKLKAKSVSSSTKKMMARRWEAALDDAYMIAIDNDI
uniref:CHK domain-containing protein n=2 Tax=Rhabditophanes sp. KR3021 TaxID=114890 RepID=A0AC35U744_9BILA